MLSIFGLLASIFVIAFLVYRGLNTIPVSIIASMVIIVSNHMPIWKTFMEGYAVALQNFAGNYFIMFVLAAIFGVMMEKSGAAFSISLWLMKILGKERVILVIFLTTLVLTYSGISTFLVAFTLYPIGLALFRAADIPMKLFPGTVLAVAATITMTMLPGTPSIQNVMPTKYLDTTIFAAPYIGIACSVLTFILNYYYLVSQQKKLASKGEHFVVTDDSAKMELFGKGEASAPSIILSLIPVVVLLVAIFSLKGVVDSLYSVVIAMSLSISSGLVVFHKKHILSTVLNDGSKNGIISLLITASVVGFGGVVKYAPSFQLFIDYVNRFSFDPLVSASVSINIFSAITGSAAGGLGIFLTALGAKYAAMQINHDAIHRVITMSSGALDAMPHSAGTVVTSSIARVEIKDTYKYIFTTCAMVPLLAIALAIIMAKLGIV
ncbi:GntP family permease [Martelella alba]|uniref:GntP family permease n=1 Tax=Martelella alba TaxID=2590451 RepID=A0ABY2SHL0_9HYPH|nr:GntP family permease [Martelella alba]TKI03739.1 GntP family permease [Martelella alba]